MIVFDNLSRPGVERNLRWLMQRHPGGLEVEIGDIRDAERVARVVSRAHTVFHLAAQVAVTSSVADPLHDFAVNAQGTLNVLQAAVVRATRRSCFTRRRTRYTAHWSGCRWS